eukprot:1835003-Amphidinium_carterae.2
MLKSQKLDSKRFSQQSAVSGAVTVACQEQSSAIAVRGMALRCYSLTVSMQDVEIMCVWHSLTLECDLEGSGSEEEQRVEEEIGSQDFINMINFSERDVDSFQLVNQDVSGSEESEESEVQGWDQSQPVVTRVQVRAHQRTLQDGSVVNVRSHSR